jgi:hypothetical protein
VGSIDWRRLRMDGGAVVFCEFLMTYKRTQTTLGTKLRCEVLLEPWYSYEATTVSDIISTAPVSCYGWVCRTIYLAKALLF